MAAYEIDHLMTLGVSGVKTYESAVEAKAEQLREWLNTPKGKVWGNRSWGTIMQEFKHEPTNLSHVQIAIESRLLMKLQEDLPDLSVQAISFTEVDFDLGKLTIQIPEGTISEEVSTT